MVKSFLASGIHLTVKLLTEVKHVQINEHKAYSIVVNKLMLVIIAFTLVVNDVYFTRT